MTDLTYFRGPPWLNPLTWSHQTCTGWTSVGPDFFELFTRPLVPPGDCTETLEILEKTSWKLLRLTQGGHTRTSFTLPLKPCSWPKGPGVGVIWCPGILNNNIPKLQSYIVNGSGAPLCGSDVIDLSTVTLPVNLRGPGLDRSNFKRTWFFWDPEHSPGAPWWLYRGLQKLKTRLFMDFRAQWKKHFEPLWISCKRS